MKLPVYDDTEPDVEPKLANYIPNGKPVPIPHLDARTDQVDALVRGKLARRKVEMMQRQVL